MRKTIVTTLAGLALIALVSGNAFACGDSKASTKSACGATKITSKPAASEGAQSADAKAGCAHSKAASGNAQLTAEERAKLCDYDGKCELTTISIAGMTCSGCEKSVSAVLSEVPGVLKVMKVSYEEGVAQVCFDPAKTTSEALTTAVADKGYKAEIIPAAATSSESKGCSKLTGAKSGCRKADKTKTEDKAEGTH